MQVQEELAASRVQVREQAAAAAAAAANLNLLRERCARLEEELQEARAGPQDAQPGEPARARHLLHTYLLCIVLHACGRICIALAADALAKISD